MKYRAVISAALVFGLFIVFVSPQASYGQISQAFSSQNDAKTDEVDTQAKPKLKSEPKKKSEKELRAEALKARKEAELRVEADMLRMTNIAEALSKNLGQIHFLRTLCFGPNDQKWRNYANDMIKVEAENDLELQSQFIRAFNAGYYQEQNRHNQCSNKVNIDVAALAENSRNLATMLGDPYRQR